MSKLADLIRRATRAEPGPMGFASGPRKPPPTMLLVALVGERWAQRVGDAVTAGADAFLLTGQPSEKELAEAVSAADGRPCGLLASADGEQPSRLRQAGLDFLVLEPQAPASALMDEKLTLLLHLRDELTDTQLRTLDALPLHAVYVERESAALTIWRQMELQRISGLARRPLMLQAQLDAQQQDLLSLREAGVALATVDLRERGAADALRRLRGVIDALPRRRALRRGERPEVTLPRAVGQAEEEEEEAEE